MEDVSVLSLLARLVASLAIVLVLMVVLARILRSRAVPGIRRATAPVGTLQVVARQQVSRGASVAVVRAADRALVLGITDAAVNLLAEIDPATLEVEGDDDGQPGGAPSWRAFTDAVRERTVRRP